MDINQLDIELNTKAKEGFKIVLKKPMVEIFFGLPNEEENIPEIITVTEGQHNYVLMKKIIENEISSINERYFSMITKKTKDLLERTPIEQRKKVIKKKTWYLFFFVPFIGKRYVKVKTQKESNRLMYNSVVIDLTKLEYDRFKYYVHYVYKLQQMYKLNKELNINQEFNIVFDDDKSAINLYKNMYDKFKGLIEPNDRRMDRPDSTEEDGDDEI